MTAFSTGEDRPPGRGEMSDLHPAAEQLRAFAVASVDDACGAFIERHLATCNTCWSVVEQADEDTPVARVLRSMPAERVRSLTNGVKEASSGARDRGAVEPPPELLDHPRYQLLGFVGAGGMGRVWKARHGLMNRVVAVKTIRPDLLLDERAVARFRREVEAAAALDHPGIVRAFDAERVGDLHFLVMEFVEGVDLARLVHERGPLPVAQACGYAAQVAAGLAYAHARNLVHRDIKPHNLLLTPGGEVKISDFGLASFLVVRDEPATDRGAEVVPSTAAGGSVTRFGDGCGTPDYIAPEQIRDAGGVSGLADIYSLGCTLYHLLAGQPPFAGGSGYSKVAGHLERQPRPLTEFRGDLPGDLVKVVAKMMAKDGRDRYASAAEAAVALAPFAGTSPPPSIRQRSTRRRFLAAGGVGLAALGGWLAVRGRTAPATPVAVGRGLGSHDGRVLSVCLSRDGRLAASGGEDRSVRVWSIDGGREVRRLDGHAGPVNAVAFSPDGEWVASGGYDRADRTVRVWDVATGRERVRLGERGHPVVRLAFSHDGTRLLSGGDNQEVLLWDVAAGSLMHRLEGHGGPVQGVAFTPDGRHAVSAGNDRTIRVWDATTGREAACLRGHAHVVQDVAASDDGRRLLSASGDGSVREWDWAGGGEVRQFLLPAGAYRAVYRAGGEPVASFQKNGLFVWDAGRGRELCRLGDPGERFSDLGLDPTGRRAVTGHDDGAVAAWDVSDS